MARKHTENDELHNMLKLQGEFLSRKSGGAGRYIYKLLRSLIYIPSPLAPPTPTKSLEDFNEEDFETVFLGMDPGNTGALGLVTSTGVSAVIDYAEPKVWRDLMFALGCFHASGHIFVTAYLELVRTFHGYHAKSSEDAIRSNGIWAGALTMTNLPYAEVLPQEWQKHHALTKSDLEQEHNVQWKSIGQDKRKKLRKESHRKKALELLPHMQTRLNRVQDHDRADALLLALMARDNRNFI